MLWRSEVKKLLLTQKGLLILAVCLILKCRILWGIPERKDSRILLSQKQYDSYLSRLSGENTREKADWILGEYAECKALRDSRKAMQDRYAAGELTEEDWTAYAQALNQAELHINSAQLFAEKAEQFLAQDPALPPAHYIYEYGWQTVFSILLVPDVFLLFGVLLLAAQCFSAEAASGMLPVLLAARNGRTRLFFAKLWALLTVCAFGALASGGVEAVVFLLRGFCGDGDVPLYSITLFSGCPLGWLLWRGYVIGLLARSLGALLLAGMLYGLSVWVKSTANLLFTAVCILVVPLLLLGESTALLFTPAGLLCTTKMLTLLGASGLHPVVPLAVVTVYTAALLPLANHRHRRGL